MSFLASLPAIDVREFRAAMELACAEAFDERAARHEDLRARVGEHEERTAFCREFEAWLDGRRDTIPDPTPETLHLSHAPESTL